MVMNTGVNLFSAQLNCSVVGYTSVGSYEPAWEQLVCSRSNATATANQKGKHNHSAPPNQYQGSNRTEFATAVVPSSHMKRALLLHCVWMLNTELMVLHLPIACTTTLYCLATLVVGTFTCNGTPHR